MSTLSPLPHPALPFYTRLSYYVCLIGIRTSVRVVFALGSMFKRLTPSKMPILVKSYPATPYLKNRIFCPPGYTSSSAPLPLYLSIHGGGFAFADPTLDDDVNAKVCADWNVLVISLDYPKTPTVRYPVPTQQLVATILSIFADEFLRFDRHRVAIGGYSAGGQLALSASLDPRLKGKIRAVAPFYPVTDFTTGAAVKKDTRPYRTEGEVDDLMKVMALSLYGYVTPGQDLRDPGLSPVFAARKDLPEWVCTVGAELDILCNEAGAMMGRLAGKELVKVGQTEGLGEPYRDGFEAEEGRLKWVLVKGATHGFTHEKKEDVDEIFRIVGEWLFNGPFKVEKSPVAG
ncbi:hypothetical protein MMC19_006846 [Ptychographa xylographoides]|nr:hypothetical protein [Ptychographa xylographoides]